MGTIGTITPELPSGEELLQREAAVRPRGTGLGATDLVGCWQLQQVWPRGSSRPTQWSSVLLRRLNARLELSPDPSGEDALAISNSVQLAGLKLRFEGLGRLIGKRPLLQFSFSSLELCFGGTFRLTRALPPSPPRRLPFFALIAMDARGWLAARGRGGGLALWLRQP